MKEGPDIASIATLIGDPARANMLTSLLAGKALTATELSKEAGIMPQTASSHLKKLEEGGLIKPLKQGRHKYFSLADEHVASALAAISDLAERKGFARTRTGPRDQALRQARVCYNHLAGEAGVALFNALIRSRYLELGEQGLVLTDQGIGFLKTELDLDPENLPASRSPLCRECLDWSERRLHLGGRLGRAIFSQFEAMGWVKRQANSRVVDFTPIGKQRFEALVATE